MFAFTPFDLFFYVVAIATVVSAFWVLFSKNIIHAAIGLLFTLFGVGGLYLMLASDFLGFLQLFIYIGATMVLIMFGIMLTRREEKGSEPGVPFTEKLASQASTYLGLFIAGAVFAFLFVILIVAGGDQWQRSAATNVQPPTSAIGEKLLTEYIYAFEIISVFLMVALIGAAYLARRRDVPEEMETIPVTPETHKKLKVAASMKGISITDAAKEALNQWCDNNSTHSKSKATHWEKQSKNVGDKE